MATKLKFSWRGLIPQIFVLVILPLTALLLAVTFGGLAIHRQAMRSLVGQRDERAVRAAASALTDQLNQRIADIRLLATSASVAPSTQALSVILERDDVLGANFDGGLAFFSPNGQLVTSAGNTELWENLDFESKPGLEEIIDPTTAPALYSPNSQEDSDLLLAAAPVSQEGPIAIGAFSSEKLIEQTLNEVFNPGESGTAFVIAQDHQLIFRIGTDIEKGNLATHPGVEAALDGNTGSTFLQAGGDEHVAAYSNIQPVGWALVIEEPWDAVASPLLVTTEYAPFVLIPVVVLALIALGFVTRWIIQPLQGLESKANELAWGNYEAIEGSTGGVAEIRHLQSALVHLAHKVKAYQQGLRGYIGAITMGQEEERHRLARELHDDTLQSLIALNQRVQLAQLGQDGNSAIESLPEIQALTEQTIQNLRRLTRNLRPIYLEDLGLVAALEMLTRETQQVSEVEVKFTCTGMETRLSAAVELALYRIAQEALSNVVRHANASLATLTIAFSQKAARLEITDNGVGFEVPKSPAEFAPTGHFGLLGLHERAEMIGGRLEISSTPGQGTWVLLYLPMTSSVLPYGAEEDFKK